MKKHNVYKKTIRILFVILLLTSCGPEKPPVNTLPPVSDDTVDDQPIEDNVSYSIGNSKPLDYSPCEGVTVKAEENVFLKDTTVEVTPMDTIPSKYDETLNLVVNEGMIPIRSWDINAGLEDNEVSPGIFEMEFDLKELGIDEEFYPGIGAVRLDESGNFYTYSTYMEGDKLHVRSRQNSPLLITWDDVQNYYSDYRSWFTVHKYTIDIYHKLKYFSEKGDPLGLSVMSVKQTTPYGTYRILWLPEDLDPQNAEKVARVKELSTKHWEDALAASKIRTYGDPNQNFDLVKYYNGLLKADDEYQRLCKETEIPEVVEYSIECANKAYDYLGSVVKVKMPVNEIKLICRTDDKDYPTTYGQAEKINSTSLMHLWPNKSKKGAESKENYLLTVIHELFHICQENYRYGEPLIGKLTDDPRFDEMVTMVVERDAKEYYIKNGIIKNDPRLTEKEKLDVLRIPIDSWPEGMSGDEAKTLMQYEGYQLGDFITYLQEQYKKKNVTPVDLMNARAWFAYYYFPTSVSGPVSRAFGMNEKEFELYYRKWLIAYRSTLVEQAVQSFYRGLYKLKDWVVAEPGMKHHVTLDKDNSFFLTLRGFNKKDYKGVLPALVIMDDDLKQEHPSFNLMPMQDYYPITKGCYLDNAGQLVMAEIFGIQSPDEDMNISYTIWYFEKTEKPELNVANDKLLIRMPTLKGAAKEGLIDGYHLVIKTDSGKIYEEDLGKEYFEKVVEYPMSKFRDQSDQDKPIRLTVTICEYVTDNDGVKRPGIVSDEAVWQSETEKCEIRLTLKKVTYTIAIENAIVYGEHPKGLIYVQAKPGADLSITVTSSDESGFQIGVDGDLVPSGKTWHWTVGSVENCPEIGYWFDIWGMEPGTKYNFPLAYLEIYAVNSYTEKPIWVYEPSWSETKKN